MEESNVSIMPGFAQYLAQELSGGVAEVYPPHLQIVCDKLVTNLPPGGGAIGIDNLQALGGVSTILETYLSDVPDLILRKTGKQRDSF
jgi:hypothetical protein